ncbi:RNA-binding KH domain-containing protein RCF3-like isoform X1 [Zingiber officinale]|uniref:RNA-binding KH domain-containing protein RCF3-like isoform X1 n=1 Tax=Zingiber officinale TaxID=94328 RepID=UPI001C4D91A1|nr:RNA-binding KH domain-containing protein RCF3-like isoform X1 [Zingiber officinale]
MSFPFLPSKHSYERNPFELNGRGKWQKTGPHSKKQKQLKAPPGATMFRILCLASKSGSFVGDSGEIVARIQKETGAKIRLEEIVSGCDERVILITGSEKYAALGNEPKKEDEVSEGSDNLKESAENVGESEDSSAPESTKVGCLHGKGGSVIKQISADSGAQIRILPKDKLPLCGTQLDEIVQITGGVDSVKKALHLVGQQLLDNPTRERDSFPLANSSGPLSHPFASIPQSEDFLHQIFIILLKDPLSPTGPMTCLTSIQAWAHLFLNFMKVDHPYILKSLQSPSLSGYSALLRRSGV